MEKGLLEPSPGNYNCLWQHISKGTYPCHEGYCNSLLAFRGPCCSPPTNSP
jgi:hypothetical protein